MEVKGNNLFSCLAEKRLVLFSGKGGVGKTSVAGAFALWAAGRGRRVMLLEVGDRRELPVLFGQPTADDGPRPLSDGISWMNLNERRALQTYGMLKLRLRSVYRAVFEQRLVRRFLQVVPALPEILVLGHLAHLVEHEPDVLHVVDAPASGQGRQMLAAPQAVLDTVSSGPLHRAVAWIHKLLVDESQTTIGLVVVGEELSVNEALELYEHLQRQLLLPVRAVVANRLLGRPLEATVRKLLERLRHEPRWEAAAGCAWRLNRRVELQQRYLDRLRAAVPQPVAELGELLEADGSARWLERLAQQMDSAEAGR